MASTRFSNEPLAHSANRRAGYRGAFHASFSAFATPTAYAGSALWQLPRCRSLTSSGASPRARLVFSKSSFFLSAVSSRKSLPGCE